MSYGLLIVYGILVLLSIVLFAVYKIKEYSIIDGITLIPVRIIIGLLMVIFLMIIIPKGSYYAINSFGDKVYYLYATDGKNDEDIFFSEKIYKSANIEDTFQNIAQEIKDIDEKKEIKDRDDIVKKYLEDKNSLTLVNKLEIISRHKVVSSKYIKANKEYVDYLQTQERDIDDVFNYCDKISSINDNVYRASFYLSFIIFIIAILFLKNRVLMYFFALIIYVPIITNDFSKGLLGSFISNLEIVSNHFSNQDIQTISSIMSSTTKEAFVTVIILDGLFQAIVSKKTESKIESRIETKFKKNIQIKIRALKRLLDCKEKNFMKDIKNFEKEIQEVHNNFKIMSKRLNELFDEKDNCGIIIQKIVKPIDSIAKSIDNIFCYLREADNLVNENHNNVIDNVSIDYINKKNDIINILKKQNNDANKNNDISKEIKNLLGSMKIIEKQIKLLSLNAEIEASRINQKGGISAIAKQMATLSEKTRDIVAQIENLSTEITRYSNNIFNESDQLMKIIESE